MSNGVVAVSELVDALGVAWTIHGLYPDPEQQPAFERAVADVAAQATSEPFTVAVGPGAFVIDGEELLTERESAERLAVRLFVHTVELLRFVEPPSERDVVRLFNILAREPEDVAESGGVTAAPSRDGVVAFAVVERSELGDHSSSEDVERDEEVQTVMAARVDPATFAQELMSQSGDDTETAGKAIHGRYHDVLGRVSPEDVAGREEVVQAFVESFFHIPDEAQVSVLEQFLANHENVDDRAFLDQFAGHELVRMSTRLDSQAMSLLMDYANVVTDPEADVRSGELLALLQDAPNAVDSARQMIANHLAERWGSMVEGSDPSGSPVHFSMPDERRYFFTVLDVFRDLLEIEDRDERFARLMRIWTGKVLSALRAREFRRAELWMRAVRDNPTFLEQRNSSVESALDSLVGPVMVEELVRYYTLLDDATPVMRFMSLFGGRLANPLIEHLATTEGASVRRVLIDMLGFVAAADPAPIVSRLGDTRWFLVRNLAVVLRKGWTQGSGRCVAQSSRAR